MNFNDFIILSESFIDPSSGKRYNFSNRVSFLEKFRGSDDVFVTFHEVPKFGLNPRNKYNTPTGIYSYPVDYVISSWDAGSSEFRVPFAGKSNFLTVFRHVKNILIRIDKNLGISGESSSGTSIDVSQRKLNTLIINIIEKLFRKLDPDIRISSSAAFSGLTVPFERCTYPNCMIKFSTDRQKIINSFINFIHSHNDMFPLYSSDRNSSVILNKIDFGALSSSIDSIISSFDPEFIKKGKYPYEDLIKPLWSSSSEFYKDKEDLLSGSLKMPFNDEETAELSCPASFVFVMLLIKAGKNKIKFNKLCRSVGIAGFVDMGTGTIHSNEKTQALFFDKNDLSLIPPSPIDNTKYSIEQSKSGHYYTQYDRMRYNWLARFADNISELNKILFSINSMNKSYYDEIRPGYFDETLNRAVNLSGKLIGMFRRPSDINYNSPFRDSIEMLISKLKTLTRKEPDHSFAVLLGLLEKYLAGNV